MKRPQKQPDGYYHIGGKKYPNLFGSRKQVKMFKSAYKTAGGLTEDDLVVNGKGRVVSKKKFHTSKKEQRLKQYGYGAKKGKFGYVKIARTTRKRRGGQRGGNCGACSGAVKLDNNLNVSDGAKFTSTAAAV
jgi:hypothetical protein